MSCHVCEALASADPDGVVYEDAAWLGYQVGHVPGWITLATREHVEGMEAMTDEQADAFGHAVRTVGGAVKAATQANRVHVVYLGEAARHVHAGLFPRRADQSPLLDNAGLVAELGSAADPQRAKAVREDVRRAVAGQA
jgi:diadenosine tetraphosphate (Ap4A) HIT family hydrolase